MKKKLVITLLSSSFFVSSVFASHQTDFTYQHLPIHPACVALFNASMADYPYISAVNVNVCQHSNAAYQQIIKKENNTYAYFVNDKNTDEGSYAYRVIGKTTNGSYVLKTDATSGGTLHASMLLLLRLNERLLSVYEGKTHKMDKVTEMQLQGYVVGGDRCAGDFANVSIAGNQLKIKQYLGDNAADCDKTREFTIDLANGE